MKKTAGAILDRIQKALGLTSDGQISRELKIGRSTVGSWRAQDRRPYEICVSLSETHGLSLDWLLTGEGEMYRGQSAPPVTVAALPDLPDDPVQLAGRQPRVAALLGVVAALSPEAQDAVLSECLSRAEAAQRLAELERRLEQMDEQRRA